MNKVIISPEKLNSLSDAINAKTGGTSRLTISEMESHITDSLGLIGDIPNISSAAAMDALLISDNVGKAYKFTGTTDSNYTQNDIYVVEEVSE